MAKAAPKKARFTAESVGSLRQAQLARLLGVSPQAVGKMRTRGIPRNPDRTYDLVAVCTWLRSGSYEVHRVSQSAILEMLAGHATRPTLLEWEQRGLPRNPDRTYSIPAVLGWLLERERAKRAELREAARGRVYVDRRAAAEAELREIELDRQRGRLLPRSSVAAGWVARIHSLRGELQAFTRRLRDLGITAPQRRSIEGELSVMLRRFAAGGVELQLTSEALESIGRLFADDLARPFAGDPDDADDADDGGSP